MRSFAGSTSRRVRRSRPMANPRIDRALPGFMFTCGPDHIRHPEPLEGDANGRRYPLHGSLSSHPARARAGQFEEDEGEGGVLRPGAGVACKRRDGGTEAAVRRRSHGPATSRWTTPSPIPAGGHGRRRRCIHINFNTRLFEHEGHPADRGNAGGRQPALAVGRGRRMKIFCVPAAKRAPNTAGRTSPSADRSLAGRSLHVRFRTDTLPYLQVWRNQSPRLPCHGIEPVSHRLAGRQELIRIRRDAGYRPGRDDRLRPVVRAGR